MKINKTALFFGLMSVVIAIPSYAQFARPEQAVSYRRAVMMVHGRHIAMLDQVAKGERPYNAQEVANSAAVVDFVSRQGWMGFIPNSDSVPASRAKPEIWTQPEKFKEAIDRFQASTTKLVSASKTGDMASLRAAVGEVNQNCKACHDAFHK